MRDVVEIGLGKSAQRGYGLRDIAIVPSRRTRDVDDVSTVWQLDAYQFKIPCVAHPSDATMSVDSVVALGHHNSGLFTTDDELAQQLIAASRDALDPLWRMPLDEEYDEALKSNFADMANVGPRAGGAITAAMFLSRFTGKYRWAHVDIAGTAWKSGAQKGATGRPVPLLTHFVLSKAG